MTPPAATVAGRTETKRRTAETERPAAHAAEGQRQRPQGARPVDSHRRSQRAAPAAPRQPRRVSGPSADAAFAAETRGLTAAAARATARAAAPKPRASAAAAPPRRAAAPRTARTARAAAAAAAAPRTAAGGATVAPRIEIGTRPSRARRQTEPELRRPLHHRALRSIVRLPDHRLLDRIVRGRAWIPVLGVLLATIVGMRVEVLKLGAGVGRSVAQASTLQSENEILRQSVSTLSGDERIEALAQKLGMVMPNTANVHFVSASGAQQAAATVTTPDPAEFRASVEEEDAANPATDVTAGMSSAVGELQADGDLVAPAGGATGDSLDSTASDTGAVADTAGVADTSDTGVTTGATADSGAADTTSAADTGTVDTTDTGAPTGADTAAADTGATAPAAADTGATAPVAADTGVTADPTDTGTADTGATGADTGAAADTGATADTGAVSATGAVSTDSSVPTTGGSGLAG